MASSLGIVAYLALFAVAGLGFVLINLLIGRLLRPENPHPEKLEIYECGEPTIGSSFVQFDLRFYVVALVFIVFDVEVAFMFPWATVYGKSLHLRELAVSNAASETPITSVVGGLYKELGVEDLNLALADTNDVASKVKENGQTLVQLSAAAMAVFFLVLLLGFAYEWKTGAMDWVRAVTQQDTATVVRGPPAEESHEDALLSV